MMPAQRDKHHKDAYSGLKKYSIGFVVKGREVQDEPYKEAYTSDQTGDKGTIEVIPIEYAVFHTGQLKPGGIKDKLSGLKKMFGISNTSPSHTIKARWLKLDDGPLAFAPMVNPGEYVQLYRFADSDVIFWTNLGHEPDLRRKDVYVWSASNINPDKDKGKDYNQREIMSEKNSHHWGVDTRNGNIFLKTVKNDGEKVAYDFIFNLKKGFFRLLDTWKNLIYTTDKHILIKHEGGMIEIKNKVVNIHGVDTVNIWSAKDVNIKTGKVNIKCDSCTVKSPKTKITGDVEIGGNLKVGGNITDTRGDLTNFSTTDGASRK
jgi:hypothetical protein